MAIITNPNWESKNARLAKCPLFMVIVENLPEALTTFRAEDEQVSLTGYGIGGYGTTGYGY